MVGSAQRSVGIAMSRLRFGVWFCCCLVTVALLVHMVVWGLVFGTELRFAEPAPIVSTAGVGETNPHLLVKPTIEKSVPEKPAQLPRRISMWDRVFEMSVSYSGSAGKLSLLLLIALVGMGVLLGAGSATRGVEKSVSAFAWTVGVGLLALPIGRMLGLSWEEGAMAPYPMIVEAVASQNIESISIHLLLPATCIVALILVGLKFSDATAEALLTPEHHFDPQLERETSNIKPGSLIGGRSAAGLTTALKQDVKPAVAASSPLSSTATKPVKPARVDVDGLPRIGQITAGEAPRRLI